MDAVIDIILERYRGLLRQGAILMDPADSGENVYALFYLEHSIQDARSAPGGTGDGGRHVISRHMQFVEIDANGKTQNAGHAPFLDYEPLSEDLREVKARREESIDRTLAAVKDRLTKEIAYWDHRAEELRAQELAGKTNARLNSELARRRADDLQARLQKRLEELEQERHISPQPPVVIGGALVIPAGLVRKLQGQPPDLFAKQRQAVEQAAMHAVMGAELMNGYEPVDVSRARLGWDIESKIPGTGKLRFIEVKGRLEGAETVTVSKNEILAGLNKPDDFFLAIVEVGFVQGKPQARLPLYIARPFQKEPDFAVVSVNYEIKKLLKLG